MQDRKSPGVEHRLLESMAGTWDADATMVLEQGSQPVQSSAVSENAMIMGGRYLQFHFTVNGANELFHGMGLLGYDRVSKCYQNFWIDDSNTRMAYIGRGQFDEAKQELTLLATIEQPDGGRVELREVYTYLTPNHFVLEMFHDHGEGEYRSMHIDYTRPAGQPLSPRES